jgi:hypothetical protein
MFMKHHAFLCSGILLLFACSNNKENNQQIDNEKIKAEIQQKEADAEQNLTASDADYKSVVILNEEDAKSFARSYNRVIRSRLLGNDDRSSSVWFDREVITLLYNAITETPRLDGVRFYFGKYPKNYKDPARAKKLTMFMLLTVPGKYNKTHNDTFYFKSQRPVTWDSKKASDFKNINHGELCPEVCDSVYYLRDQY